jgi:hypothetical protein
VLRHSASGSEVTHSGRCRETEINVRLSWNRRKVKSRKISSLEQTRETNSNHEMPDTSRMNYNYTCPYKCNNAGQGSASVAGCIKESGCVSGHVLNDLSIVNFNPGMLAQCNSLNELSLPI